MMHFSEQRIYVVFLYHTKDLKETGCVLCENILEEI